jgi:hypothetical protein
VTYSPAELLLALSATCPTEREKAIREDFRIHCEVRAVYGDFEPKGEVAA